MTNYENLLNLPMNFNGNELNGDLNNSNIPPQQHEAVKMSQRDFSEVSWIQKSVKPQQQQKCLRSKSTCL